MYSTVPAPDRCTLHYLHFDERGTSTTLGLTTSPLPDRPRPEWKTTPFNRLTFHLVCEHLTEVTLNGWELPPPTLQLPAITHGLNVTAETRTRAST